MQCCASGVGGQLSKGLWYTLTAICQILNIMVFYTKNVVKPFVDQLFLLLNANILSSCVPMPVAFPAKQ